MPKDLRFTLLFDVYGPLLTEKQRETLELYYNEDLSLGEISEQSGITRQGVMNCIKASEQRLIELESQLGTVGRYAELEKLVGKLEEQISYIRFSDEAQRKSIIGLLNEIREKL